MKKILILLFIFCFIGFWFINKQEKKEEFVFWTLQMSSFKDYLEPIIKNFEKENNIKIKWVDIPYSEGEKRTLASILTDNPPDLINLTPDFSISLAQKGALFFIDKKYMTHFNPNIINSLKYNEKFYAFPFYATSAVCVYNKKLSNKAGLKPPKTYEQLNEQTKIIKEKLGIFAYLPTLTENDTFLKILNKYDIYSFKDINSLQSQKIFNEYKYLYQNNLIPKESLTFTHQEALEKYMAEKIVYIVIGANFLNMIKENSPDVYNSSEISSQIIGSSKKYDFSLMNFVIPSKAKHKDLAIKLALYITNKENQLNLSKKTTILPVNKEALNDKFFKNYQMDLVSKARFISVLQLQNIQKKTYFIKNQKEILTQINDSTQEILTNKNSTEEILKKLSKNWNLLENN